MHHDDDRITGRLDESLPAHVAPLRSLHNHRISEGDPDVRGWEVYGADDRRIGRVDDLLVDTHTMKTRYLSVTLEFDHVAGGVVADPVPTAPGPLAYGAPLTATTAMGGLAPVISETLVRNTLTADENRLTMDDRPAGGRRVLIPVSQARLDPRRDRVQVEGLRAEEAASLPDYDGGEIHSHHEIGEGQVQAGTARAAGLEPGPGAGDHGDRPITGELDRAVDAPDHSVLEEEPVRGR
ncbi:MAG TPA: PRC-barrel domain-containing protein [Thermoanaerobaculia bacterium]